MDDQNKKPRKLTDRQKRFVDEYIVDLCATQAAIRAGYSEKAASQLGYQVLAQPHVQKAIAERQKEIQKRVGITQDMVINELAKIGFSDVRKAVKWGSGMPVHNPDTGEIDVVNGLCLINSDDIDNETAAAIAEISQTSAGIKIKFHDKRAALVDLGRHLGMFTGKMVIEHDMPPMFMICGPDSDNDDDAGQ